MKKNILAILLLTSYLSCGNSVSALAKDKSEAPAPDAKVSSKDEETFELLNLFGDVFERVRSDYVEPVKENQLIESAINGMLVSLDPHSSYMNEKSFEDMQVQTKGEFGGLGIEVTMENGLVKVVSPIDDTPAFKAGIQNGDYITHIDGEQVMGLTLQEAVDKLRGAVGAAVKITIAREGAQEPIDMKIIRAIIKVESVKSRPEKDVGYIRITQFNENTFSGLQTAIDDLKKQIPGMKGIVLDLRNNPGGLLNEAIAVSDAFLEKGEVVSTRGRTPDSIRRFNANAGDLINGLPIVVLMNSGSASASEIVAGALQDHKRAIIMGTKSFGKGSVQTVMPIPDHGAIRLTTARYYTPSGNSIQAKGITPDIMVEQAKIETVKQRERHEADLRGRLENDRDKEANKPSKEADESENIQPDAANDNKITPKKDDKKSPNAKDSKLKPGEIDSEKDFQLSRALDLIRGLGLYNNRNSEVPAVVTPQEKPKQKAQ